MPGNKCSKCGRSYGSTTHARRCRGLTGSAFYHWRNNKNASRRGASGGRGFTAASVLSWIPINTDALPARNYTDTPALVEVRS